MDCGVGLPGMPSAEGGGGARKRMKSANATMSLGIWALDWLKFVRSSGVVLNIQDAGAFARSSGNSSLVTPISTLYASPAKTSSDLFWAFHPKRMIDPSLPLMLG